MSKVKQLNPQLAREILNQFSVTLEPNSKITEAELQKNITAQAFASILERQGIQILRSVEDFQSFDPEKSKYTLTQSEDGIYFVGNRGNGKPIQQFHFAGISNTSSLRPFVGTIPNPRKINPKRVAKQIEINRAFFGGKNPAQMLLVDKISQIPDRDLRIIDRNSDIQLKETELISKGAEDIARVLLTHPLKATVGIRDLVRTLYSLETAAVMNQEISQDQIDDIHQKAKASFKLHENLAYQSPIEFGWRTYLGEVIDVFSDSLGIPTRKLIQTELDEVQKKCKAIEAVTLAHTKELSPEVEAKASIDELLARDPVTAPYKRMLYKHTGARGELGRIVLHTCYKAAQESPEIAEEILEVAENTRREGVLLNESEGKSKDESWYHTLHEILRRKSRFIPYADVSILQDEYERLEEIFDKKPRPKFKVTYIKKIIPAVEEKERTYRPASEDFDTNNPFLTYIGNRGSLGETALNAIEHFNPKSDDYMEVQTSIMGGFISAEKQKKGVKTQKLAGWFYCLEYILNENKQDFTEDQFYDLETEYQQIRKDYLEAMDEE